MGQTSHHQIEALNIIGQDIGIHHLTFMVELDIMNILQSIQMLTLLHFIVEFIQGEVLIYIKVHLTHWFAQRYNHRRKQ